MGKLSRNKGRKGEQDIVNVLKSYGVPAKRISMMETGGIDKGDVEVAEVWKGSVKRGQFIPQWYYKAIENCQFLFFRRDREKWMVQMDLEFFLENFIQGK